MFYHGIIDLISFCEFAKGLRSPNMLSHLGIFQSNIKKKIFHYSPEIILSDL